MRRTYFFTLVFLLTLLTVPVWGVFARAQDDVQNGEAQLQAAASSTLYFFYSVTCPHCREQHTFLDSVEERYPSLHVARYEATDANNVPLMRSLARDHGAERVLGQVPLTFVGGEYFVGFNSPETTGVQIEEAIARSLGIQEEPAEMAGAQPEESSQVFAVPLLGELDAAEHSLPALAVLLGFLDGFNVCSLGALVLIIGLSLKLQRRRAIVLFGGTFILTTAIVYGGLIVAWYHIFELFNQYLDLMKLAVALLALGGGLYFLKEFLRMQKEGAVCQLQESRLICRLMEKTGHAFEDNTRLMGVLGAVLVFAAVVAVVEFPCSAAVPVVFAGILAEAGLSTVAYLSHIGLFVLFYMLDELVIFGVAAYKLRLWMTNGRFTKWAVFAEAFILLAIGLWYLGATTGLV